MVRAIEVFNSLEKGILNIIKAADVYGLHLLTGIRKETPPIDTIDNIVHGHYISGLNVFYWEYSDVEREMLESNGHFRAIGQQIIMASYTAVELYLVNKFKEYYRFSLKDKPDMLITNSIRRFSYRSLDEIRKLYFDLLNIHLPSFDIEFHTTEKSIFQPKTSWDAIVLLSCARNEIAHQGKTTSYRITTLMDSWYPFDFCRRWVNLFDFNFDYLIYEGRESSLIKEYKQRVSKITSKT
jgi:hypothetical protein